MQRHESFVAGWCKGFIAACNIWGLGMFLQMASFAALAQELGWTLAEIITATYLIWGLPGQLAMVDMTASGASLLMVFFAVTMANARMAAMTISSQPLLPFKSFAARLLASQVMGVTLWLYTREQLVEIPEKMRGVRYVGFASFMLMIATLGCILGYSAIDVLPDALYRLLVFLGPVFLMLIISASKQKAHRLTVLLGAVFCVLSTPFTGAWAVILAGLLMGTLGFVLARRGGGVTS